MQYQGKIRNVVRFNETDIFHYFFVPFLRLRLLLAGHLRAGELHLPQKLAGLLRAGRAASVAEIREFCLF